MSTDHKNPVTWQPLESTRTPSHGLTPFGGTLLTAFLVGFPFWWIAGLASFGFIIVGFLLGYQLLQVKQIKVPNGFGIWILFLMVVLMSALTLWVPVPGLIPESGLGRILSWAFRLSWFIAGTCVMLFIGNADERVLPTRRVVLLFAWLFTLTVLGGYAGNFASGVDFPSILEVLLPRSVATHPFVSTLIHPGLAQVQDFLGYDSPRPKAPFEYANSWGANFGMLLPYFMLSITFAHQFWVRVVLAAILILAIPPVIFSLNRGMWVGLGALLLLFLIRMGVTGKLRQLFLLISGITLASIILVMSPLFDLMISRIDNPHSNSGRSNLAAFTIRITMEHSPIIGFGSTRTRQGNFFSIAAGATADCHQCSPPQLGTQGTLWFLIFCTGVLGTSLFVAFLVRRFARLTIDGRTVPFAVLASVVYFAFVLPVYDTISSPFFVLMAGMGLAWRFERLNPDEMYREGQGT